MSLMMSSGTQVNFLWGLHSISYWGDLGMSCCGNLWNLCHIIYLQFVIVKLKKRAVLVLRDSKSLEEFRIQSSLQVENKTKLKKDNG